MSITFHCTCGKPLKSKEEMAGRKTKCPHCGAILTIPGTLVKSATATATTAAIATAIKDDHVMSVHPDALRVEGLDWTSPSASVVEKHSDASLVVSAPALGGDSPKRPDPPRPDDGSKQYKVLGQRDHSASGKFNLSSLETTLNEQAHLGWVMKSAFVINLPGHAGNHDEVIVILER